MEESEKKYRIVRKHSDDSNWFIQEYADTKAEAKKKVSELVKREVASFRPNEYKIQTLDGVTNIGFYPSNNPSGDIFHFVWSVGYWFELNNRVF